MKNLKKIFAILCCSVFAMTCATLFSGCDILGILLNSSEPYTSESSPSENSGDGMEVTNSGVIVSSANGLKKLINQINDNELSNEVKIQLSADINMQGIDYTPIYEFSGEFDGMGHKISNLQLPLDGASIQLTDGNWVGYTVTSIGFISSAYNATIRNLTLENVSVDLDTDKEIFVGAVVGYAVGVVIEDCSVSSVMKVDVTHANVGVRNISGVAGVVGYSLDAKTENVSVNCEIEYTANSYEAFVGSVLGVGNVRVQDCTITLDISFVGDRYGHTGSVIGMERTPENVILASMYGSTVRGTLYIDNPSGYDWGEVGQGYLYDPETRELLDVEAFNTIDVTKTKA